MTADDDVMNKTDDNDDEDGDVLSSLWKPVSRSMMVMVIIVRIYSRHYGD